MFTTLYRGFSRHPIPLTDGISFPVVFSITYCSLQLLLGAPFLSQHPVSYLSRSFELGRVFKFEWTVNFKFLSETAFVSPVLSVALLALTVATLSLFASKWLRSHRAVKRSAAVDVLHVDERGGMDTGGGDKFQLDPEYVVKTLFVSNFIGIVFCRSLHYQVRTEPYKDEDAEGLASWLPTIVPGVFCCVEKLFLRV